MKEMQNPKSAAPLALNIHTNNGIVAQSVNIENFVNYKETQGLGEPLDPAEPRPISVVILTAIDIETKAVLRHLSKIQRRVVSGTWFHVGHMEGWGIAVAEVGAGNVIAAAVAARAFTHFNPKVAAFIGIAGGVKDVGLGDVVVATKVYGYESGKDTPGGFISRASVQTSDHDLEQRARALRTTSDWYRRLDPALPPNHPSVFVSPIAAGEAVVATNRGRIASLLKSHYSDAVAVEMEGRGFLEAAHIDSHCKAVVVRGISDLLQNKSVTDQANWRLIAADSAAAFFFEMLSLESEPLAEERKKSGAVFPEKPSLNAQKEAPIAKIPPSLTYVVGDVLGKWYNSHSKLNTLFGAAGFPGDAPAGNCVHKSQEWLRRANEQTTNPLELLGEVLVEYMNLDLQSNPQWIEGFTKITVSLDKNGLVFEINGVKAKT